MAHDKKSFLLYCDIIHTVKKMPKDKVADLFLHILEYVNDENPETDDIIIQLTFEPIKQTLKRDLKKYESICNRNSINGSLGGRPKKNQSEPKKPSGLFNNPNNPSEPKKADSDSDSDSDSDIGNDKGIKKKNNIFIIPEILEIKNYCIERKNNIDAEKFYHFYNSKGWMIGKSKMKDWKSAIHTWENNQQQKQQTTKPELYR